MGKERGFLNTNIDVLNENEFILEMGNGDKNEREVTQATETSTETNTESII